MVNYLWVTFLVTLLALTSMQRPSTAQTSDSAIKWAETTPASTLAVGMLYLEKRVSEDFDRFHSDMKPSVNVTSLQGILQISVNLNMLNPSEDWCKKFIVYTKRNVGWDHDANKPSSSILKNSAVGGYFSGNATKTSEFPDDGYAEFDRITFVDVHLVDRGRANLSCSSRLNSPDISYRWAK